MNHQPSRSKSNLWVISCLYWEIRDSCITKMKVNDKRGQYLVLCEGLIVDPHILIVFCFDIFHKDFCSSCLTSLSEESTILSRTAFCCSNRRWTISREEGLRIIISWFLIIKSDLLFLTNWWEIWRITRRLHLKSINNDDIWLTLWWKILIFFLRHLAIVFSL